MVESAATIEPLSSCILDISRSTESEQARHTMRLNGKPICVRTHTIRNTTNDEVPQLSIFQMTPQTPFLHYRVS